MADPAPWTGSPDFPWARNRAGTWRYAPDSDGNGPGTAGSGPVRLSAGVPLPVSHPDDPWEVTPAEAQRLAESPEWSDYVAAEVADVLARHPGYGS